jgi:Protein of unknown function (DUF4235)
MNKLMYRLATLAASMLGGLLAGAIVKKAWQLTAGQDEVPEATDADRSWPEVLLAAGLQGVVSGLIKAVLDRGAAVGAQRLTGQWPGEQEEAGQRRAA